MHSRGSNGPSPGSLQLPPSPINYMGEGTWASVCVGEVRGGAGAEKALSLPTPSPIQPGEGGDCVDLSG